MNPFDELKRNNPVPGDDVPVAPMALADRIVAGKPRRSWPGWVTAAVAAASVAVVGFGLLWFFNEDPGGGFGAGDLTTTTEAPTTTIQIVEGDAVVYFFLDQVGAGWSSGPYLVPVHAVVGRGQYPTESERIAEEVFATMEALLAGPTSSAASAVPAMSTAIPAGTTVLGIGVEEGSGVISVDLSSEFGSGGGTLSMMGRLGQVVYTLTGIDGVTGVRFFVEGVPTTVFGGEGIIVNDPATRAEFEGLLPAVVIDSPAYGALDTTNPLVARGSANVFEATVSLALTDADGVIIWEGFTTATCGTGCRGEWEITIPYEVTEPQWGSIIAWESSAMDGSQTNVREHPVWLVPAAAGSTTTMPAGACSGTEAGVDLLDEPDLPAPVAASRAALFAAAGTCDWEALRGMLGEGFSYTFGIDEDAIAYWQEREAAGEPVMYLLAELLNRPYRVIEAEGGPSYYVWPSAHGIDWAFLPEADREALRPLYDDEDFAFFAEFGGYVGYRVGIREDGTWVYFIAGD